MTHVKLAARIIHKLANYSLLLISLICLSSLALVPARAQTLPSEGRSLSQEKAQTLLDFAKVWRDLKYLHTGANYQARDWDHALITTAAQIKAAKNSAELSSALTEFMTGLNDPAFSVSLPQAAPKHLVQRQLQLRWLSTDTAYLSLPKLGELQQENPALNEVQLALNKSAKNLILDLRPSEFSYEFETQLADFLSHYISQNLPLPQKQSRWHIGYASQTRASSGDFSSRIMTSSPVALAARGQRDLKFVFIINPNLPLPAVLLALRQRGLAAILSIGDANLSKVTDLQYRSIASLPVIYSLSQLRYSGKHDGKVYDQKISLAEFKKMNQAQLDQAASALFAYLPKSATAQRTFPAIDDEPKAMPAESAYAEQNLPNLALRELAVLKLWAVMDSFFPYMDLIPVSSWDNASKQALIEMQNLTSRQQYEQVIKRMLASLSDSHIAIRRLTNEDSQRVWPAIRFAYAESQVVVQAVSDKQTLLAGIRPGDVLTEINHQAVQLRLDDLRTRISASSTATFLRDALYFLLVGDAGSTVHLTFRKADGTLSELELTRVATAINEDDNSATHYPINQQLAYINLKSISTTDFSQALASYKNHAALILDLRNYPNLLPHTLGKILGAAEPKTMALFRTRVLSADIAAGDKLLRETQQKNYGLTGLACQQAKIVLINEETQSRAEHLGLFIKELCPTIFIGRPSAGTNGDATYTLLPGNLEVQFSGAAVFHANGQQLQRLGLQPSVLVSRSLADLASGIDAELAAAINYGMQNYGSGALNKQRQAGH